MLHGSHAADHDGHRPSVLRSSAPRGVRADRVLGPVPQHGQCGRAADRRADHEPPCLSSGPTGPHADGGRDPPGQSRKSAHHRNHRAAEEGPAGIPGRARRHGGCRKFGPLAADRTLRMNGIRTIAVDGRAVASAPCADLNSYPFFAFRIWYGMTVSAWLALLTRNRFAVSPTRVALGLFGFVTSFVNSSLNVVQRLIFGKRIRECALDAPPIFIIGHWRTGTTFLHELLTLDERFTAPSTIECFAPAQCLAFGWLLRRFTFCLPANRPMDNMLVAWDHPQEDECALMNLGLGSPYEAMIFPNHRTAFHPYLNMTALAPEQIAAWKTG